MRPRDQARADKIEDQLIKFAESVMPLPGIESKDTRKVLVEQLIESIRRIEFVHFIRDHPIDPKRADPASEIFDPIRAAVFHMRNGEYDEAFWLVFLFVHFGKHEKDGWRLVRDIYGALGGTPWTWSRVSAAPDLFRAWLEKNEITLRADGISRRFGNHRKYESLSASSPAGTAAVVESYVKWVGPSHSHQKLIQNAHVKVGQNPREVFAHLYASMSVVRRFGRLGKFDFLAMLGKIGLAPVEPNSAYLSEATGPLRGARLLFGGDVLCQLSAREAETALSQLDAVLGLGMQVLEDALCNWQKSPKRFVSFRG